MGENMAITPPVMPTIDEKQQVAGWAAAFIKQIRSAWLVVATLLAFATSINTVFPAALKPDTPVGTALYWITAYVFDRPALTRRELALDKNAPHNGFVYYETTDKGGLRVTDGWLQCPGRR
jgi:hypothetical protein